VIAAVLACTVCGAAVDNGNAFLIQTVFMSLLPLALLGGGVGLVWWYSRQSSVEA